VGLLSIYPTVTFLAWRKDLREDRLPVLDAVTLRRLKIVIHTEMTGVLLIILCAALMARGVGVFG
jgi:putative membrane protein